MKQSLIGIVALFTMGCPGNFNPDIGTGSGSEGGTSTSTSGSTGTTSTTGNTTELDTGTCEGGPCTGDTTSSESSGETSAGSPDLPDPCTVEVEDQCGDGIGCCVDETLVCTYFPPDLKNCRLIPGELCIQNKECQFYQCVGGKCAECLPDGTSCGNSLQCCPDSACVNNVCM